ncbi:hypothetical protein IP98_02520 [Flavobacterium cauense R2A-7]|uniref:Uncharacterized protein n=1 Tax=Flavobacterium cauense R2A-7 TaxID=1341154 RepID=A0A562LP54_9FLAO|nr:hypothetical protein [Flavobacterium cauense]KGO80354.1 hypothetical protein Q762_12010 [Flavobacterium cauense R2A-7]TWI09358.1 hypothetical protein IP98_02520 [Flavobacterium cauense R2A-7]
MKIKVTKEQFYLLLVNFNILGDKELAIQMNGTTFNKIVESKKSGGNLYKVKIWVGAIPSEIIVSAGNSATAILLAKKMFPNARVTSINKM